MTATPPHWFFEDNYGDIKPPVRTTHNKSSYKGDTSNKNALMIKDGSLTTKYEYSYDSKHNTLLDRNDKGLVDGKTACGQLYPWYLLDSGISRKDIDFEAYGIDDNVVTLEGDKSEAIFNSITPVSAHFTDELPNDQVSDAKYDIGRYVLISFKETSINHQGMRATVANLPTAVIETPDGSTYELLGYCASNTTAKGIDGCHSYTIGILPVEALCKVEKGQTYKITFKEDSDISVNTDSITLTRERR